MQRRGFCTCMLEITSSELFYEQDTHEQARACAILIKRVLYALLRLCNWRKRCQLNRRMRGGCLAYFFQA